MQRAILEQLKKKRLIFTVTTGRSGTAFLASILGYAKGVTAFHEPPPEFADVLRDAQQDSQLAQRFLIEKKLPAIAQSTSPIYVETSHLVCKGFLERFLELEIVPDLIIHRRDARDVALSMYKMGTIPGRSDKGLRFYLSPEDPGVLQVHNWQAFNDYQLCFWYCLEIERRAQLYKVMCSQHGGCVVETTLKGLKSYSGLLECFRGLGLEVRRPKWLTGLRFSRGTKIKVNESKETKKPLAIPDNVDQLEAQVFQNIDSHDLRKYFPQKIGNS